MTLPLVLFVLSLGLVLIEVFIPSMGVLTLASLGCFIASLVLAFEVSTNFGLALVAGGVVGLPIILYMSFKLFPKTPIGKLMILSGSGQAPERRPGKRHAHLVGKEGLTRSLLRPSGVADFEGQRVDVLTRGEMVEPGVRIEVIEVKGNRVVVRPLEAPDPDAEEEIL